MTHVGSARENPEFILSDFSCTIRRTTTLELAVAARPENTIYLCSGTLSRAGHRGLHAARPLRAEDHFALTYALSGISEASIRAAKARSEKRQQEQGFGCNVLRDPPMLSSMSSAILASNRWSCHEVCRIVFIGGYQRVR